MAEKIISKSAADTEKLAAEITQEFKTGTLVALKGELGAGKTTFAQGLGKLLGVGRMTSPTYTLIREYPVDDKKWPFSRLYHIDLYRLSSKAEILDLGLNEIWFDPKNLILIEWPEKIEEYLPKPHLTVDIKKLEGEKREITIER